MLVVTSPAKKLDFSENALYDRCSIPDFLDQSLVLIKALKKLSRSQLATLMKLSDKLVELNYQRYRDFSLPFTPENAKQAAFAFVGDTYIGLQATTLSPDDLAYGQDHYRILSGLYGLLRPLDLIQPYRLEMGTRLATGQGPHLYDFWGMRLTAALNDLLAAQGTEFLVNCASQEYARAIIKDKFTGQIITPIFEEVKHGLPRQIGIFAKKARGLMTRYIIQNRLSRPEDLKAFNLDGYHYEPGLSDATTLVFHRAA